MLFHIPVQFTPHAEVELKYQESGFIEFTFLSQGMSKWPHMLRGLGILFPSVTFQQFKQQTTGLQAGGNDGVEGLLGQHADLG